MQLNIFTLTLLGLGMLFLILKKCGIIDMLDKSNPANNYKYQQPVQVFDLNTPSLPYKAYTGPTGLLW